MPSNICTKTVQMYNNQETINIEDDMPITYLGYQVDKSWSHITDVYAVHISGNKIEWFTDIADLAFRNQIVYSVKNNDVAVAVKSSIKKKQAM